MDALGYIDMTAGTFMIRGDALSKLDDILKEEFDIPQGVNSHPSLNLNRIYDPLFQDLQKILSLEEHNSDIATFNMVDVDIESMEYEIQGIIKVGVCLTTDPNCSP